VRSGRKVYFPTNKPSGRAATGIERTRCLSEGSRVPRTAELLVKPRKVNRLSLILYRNGGGSYLASIDETIRTISRGAESVDAQLMNGLRLSSSINRWVVLGTVKLKRRQRSFKMNSASNLLVLVLQDK